MATTVGDVILSDEMIVAQSDTIAPGTEVESLVIEFDEAKYEEFVSSGGMSPTSARKYRKVSRSTEGQEANAVDTISKKVRWVAKQPTETPVPDGMKVLSKAGSTSNETQVQPLSKRARQR
jgi:hypothetical protein